MSPSGAELRPRPQVTLDTCPHPALVTALSRVTCHVSRGRATSHCTPGRLHAPPLYSAHFWSDPFHLCAGFTGLTAQVAPSNSSLPLKLKQFFLTRHEAGLRGISQITDRRTQTSVSKYFCKLRRFYCLLICLKYCISLSRSSLLPPACCPLVLVTVVTVGHSWSQLVTVGPGVVRGVEMCTGRPSATDWGGRATAGVRSQAARHTLHTAHWILDTGMRAECGDVLMLAADFLLPLISSLLLVTAAAPLTLLQLNLQVLHCSNSGQPSKMYSYLQDKKTCGYWHGDQTSQK